MEHYEKYDSILSNWFVDVPETEINNLLIRQFEAEEAIVLRDRPFQNIYILLDGICNVINQLDNGTEVITLKLTSGYLIGVSESILGSIRNIASVKACTPVAAVEMENSVFRDWLIRYPSFTNFVLRNLLIRLHYTASFAANCQTSASKINLAKYLMERYNVERTSYPPNYSGTIIIYETHEMISSFLGISPRTVERQLSSLKKEGLIGTSKGKVSISPSQYQNLLQHVTLNL